MSTIDHEKNDARTSAKNGVKALLSIPPADVAKWMVVAATEDGSTTNNNSNKTEDDPVVPIDLSFFTREAEEMERTQAASKRAQAQLLANGGSSKKGRASAEAEVTKLRKAMAGQRARQVDSAELLQGAAQALLSPTVLKSLDDALEKAQTRCDDENSTKGCRRNQLRFGLRYRRGTPFGSWQSRANGPESCLPIRYRCRGEIWASCRIGMSGCDGDKRVA